MHIPHLLLLFIIISPFFHATPTIAQTNITCLRGTYRTTDGTCKPCLPGTFSNRTNLSACFPCPPGTIIYFRGAQSRNVCSPCPPNTISTSQGSSVCTPCEKGFVSRNALQCIRCPPGTYVVPSFYRSDVPNRMKCQPCGQSAYSTTFKAEKCLPCPNGSFSSTNNSISIQQCVNKCPKGQISSNGQCYPCLAGRYLPDTTSNSISFTGCTFCPTGFRSDKASTQCEPCKPGEYGIASFSYTSPDCVKCPNGTTTKGKAATMCRIIGGPCPVDHFEDFLGDCRKCTNTQRFDPKTKTCIPCGENELSKGKDDQTCVKCADIIGTELFSNSICIRIFGENVVSRVDGKCPPGSSISSKDAEICVKCGLNTYSNTTNAVKCEKCPTGTFATEPGSASCDSCPDGMIFYSVFSKCVMQETNCLPGEVLFFDGLYDICERTDCSIPRPKFGRAEGRCNQCRSGSGILKPGSNVCIECKFDEYSSAELGECRKCPNGTVQSDINADECICSGEYAAYRGIVNGTCQKCPVGQAGVFDKATGKNVCRSCPAGKFYRNKPEGIVGVCFSLPCYPDKVCRSCKTGFYTDTEGALACVRCPNGTTTGGPGESECKPLMIEK